MWSVVILLLFGVGWVILQIIEGVSTASSNTTYRNNAKKAFEAEKDFEYPNRIIDTSKSLLDRNWDIIEKHLQNVSTASSKYRYYHLDNITRDCINAICLAEGENSIFPGSVYLADWKMNASAEWVELADQIKELFSNKEKQSEENRKNEESRNEKENVNRLLSKYKELISQFNEVAYRKVTTIDNYGEENQDALYKELDVLVTKIAKKEGFNDKEIKDWAKHSWGMPAEYPRLRKVVASSFNSYYNSRKKNSVKNNDVSKMSGVDFENHLAQLLKESGFTNVSGTPKTGDQGADLIAKKGGKTIIIQAKRYEGNVGNKAVQEVIGAIRFYDGDEGWVITNSAFTKSARELAHKNKIKLIDGADLERFSEIV